MRVGNPLRNQMAMSLAVGFVMVHSGCDSSSQGRDVAALSISVEGEAAAGMITSQPAGISCGTTCSSNFDFGAAVSLSATAAESYEFVSWGGACTGSSPTCSLTLDGAKVVSAAFRRQQVNLMVTIGGSGGGVVTSTPAGLMCSGSCSAGFDKGSQVTLTAAPGDSKLSFTGWGGACSGQTPTCTLSLTADTQVTASFGYFATCEELRVANPTAIDGNYTLFLAGDKTKPWGAFCLLSVTPAQSYLNLTNTGANQNFSQYTAGGGSSGSSIKTNYTKVLIDPVTLKVDTNAQKYATTTGGPLSQGAVPITAMPYATAFDCRGSLSQTGLANIDLTGTPFAVAAGALVIAGSSAAGAATPTPNGQVRVLNLTGGGNCGWNAPIGSFNPYNQSGSPLNLVYFP